MISSRYSCSDSLGLACVFPFLLCKPKLIFKVIRIKRFVANMATHKILIFFSSVNYSTFSKNTLTIL